MIVSESCENKCCLQLFFSKFWFFFIEFFFFLILTADQRVEFLCSTEEDVSILSQFNFAFTDSSCFLFDWTVLNVHAALDKSFRLLFYIT